MKIRITGKPIPKAQVGIINQSQSFSPQDNTGVDLWSSTFTNPVSNPFLDKNKMYKIDQTPGDPVSSYPIIPIPQPKKPWQYYVNKGIDQANDFLVSNPYMKKAENIGNLTMRAVDVLSPIANSIAASKYDHYIRDYMHQSFLPDNMYSPISGTESGNRGDYDINTGAFRPNELGFKGKGQTVNPYYAPNNFAQMGGTMINDTTMGNIKIKITGLPEAAYGGQMGYGLDIGGRRIYTDMPESKADSVSNTLQPVPREQANIEAEKGETVYGDLDGDGAMEHMNVAGERHIDGGTPLNVPEGSFVFSDTKKMRIKDPEVLKMFGKSMKTGGYTPAEIAKQYNLNKYKGIIQDPDSDALSKSTAELMVKNYQDKLGKLAVVQEAKKGFPQGIPQIAMPTIQTGKTEPTGEQFAYGGSTTYMQNGGGSDKGKRKTWPNPQNLYNPYYSYLTNERPDELIMPSELEGNSYYSLLSPQHKDPKTGLYGGAALKEFMQRHNWYFKDHPDFNPNDKQQVKAFQEAYNDEAQKRGYQPYFANGDNFRGIDGLLGKYTAAAPGWKPQEDQPTLPEVTVTAPKKKQAEYYGPNQLNKPAVQDSTLWDFMTPDKIDMLASSMYPPKKYGPRRASMPFTPGNVAYSDWLANAQARQSQFNKAADTLGTYQPGSALASNLSYMAGQNAEGIANDIAQTDARNVGTFNEYSARERQRQDQNNMFNTSAADQYYRDAITANQQYDNAKRAYVHGLAKTFGNAWANRMYLGMINAVNPVYNVDPITGKSYFKQGYGVERLMAGMPSGSSTSGSGNWSSINQSYLEAKRQIPDLTFTEFMRYTYPRASYSDTDQDGIPNTMRYNGYSGLNMMNMMGMYGNIGRMGAGYNPYTGY